MNDSDFRELELKTICPSADQWPSEYLHQKVAKAAANEAVEAVRAAYGKLDAVEANRDLSAEGKRRQQAKLATEEIGKLENSKTPERVAEAIGGVMQKWQAKIDANLKHPNDAHEIAVFAQIRDRLHNLRDPKERMSFLEKHGNDLTLISAVLTAPAYLSGLSDAEYQFVKSQLEKQAPFKIVAARSEAQKMLAEVEIGWRAAVARIAKRGGLVNANAAAMSDVA